MHSDKWSPYEEEARELAMLASNARENPRYQIGLVFTLHSVSIHVYMTTRAYLGTNRIGNPVGETLQHIKGDIICHRLTRQLMYIVQVKFHRVYFEIWMEIGKLGEIPVVVGWFETEHEADDKG